MINFNGQNILDGSIQASKLAPEFLSSISMYLSNSGNSSNNFTFSNIPDFSITTSKLALGAVSSSNLATGSVTSAKLNPDLSFNSLYLGKSLVIGNDGYTFSNSVNLNGQNILDGSIQISKLAPEVLSLIYSISSSSSSNNNNSNFTIPNESITSAQLAIGAVETSNLATGSVTSSKIDPDITLNSLYLGDMLVIGGGGYDSSTNIQISGLNIIDGSIPASKFSDEIFSGFTINKLISNNQILIGGTTSSYPMEIFNMYNSVSLKTSGSVLTSGTNTLSDIRLKTNVSILDPEKSLEKINELKPCRFDMKETGKTNFGLIAQDVYEVLPELIESHTDCVPDILENFEVTDIIDGRIIKLRTRDELQDFIGKTVRCKYDGNNFMDAVVVDSETIEAIEAKAKIAIDEIFVVGKYVDDVKSVKYDQIISYLISAVQSLSKQISHS
jgi:hypothetical protein